MNHQSHHHHHLTCPDRQTNKHTDRTNNTTSSHPSSQKTQLVHTRMAHTLGHHNKSLQSSQTVRHCYRHDQKLPPYSSEYSSEYSSKNVSHQRSPPDSENQKGSTSASQNTSFKASTRQNQSQTKCKSKAKQDLKIVSLPSKTRSGRTVRLPGRYRE